MEERGKKRKRKGKKEMIGSATSHLSPGGILTKSKQSVAEGHRGETQEELRPH